LGFFTSIYLTKKSVFTVNPAFFRVYILQSFTICLPQKKEEQHEVGLFGTT